ncbi:acyl-CoA carboxylase subunit epsilon [Streptomyces sp. NPDC002446]
MHDDDALIRVERGCPDREELAAVSAVLLSRVRAGADSATVVGEERSAARWSRPDRRTAFRSPHSWQ